MKIAYNNPNPGVFFHAPGSTDGAGVKVRALNKKVSDEIMEKVTTTEEEVAGNRVVERQHVDEKKKAELTFDYCITELVKLEDEEGVEIPTTKQSKLKLMRENPPFSLFIQQAIQVAGSLEALRADADLKNFFTS